MAIEIPVTTTLDDSPLDAMESRIKRLEGRGVNLQINTTPHRVVEEVSNRAKEMERRVSPMDKPSPAETEREITGPAQRAAEEVSNRAKTTTRKAPKPKEPRFPVGPAQRYLQAERDLERVLSTGDDAKIFDALINSKRQEAAVLRAHELLAPKLPKTPVGSMDRLQQARRELAQAAAAAYQGTGTSEALFAARVKNARAEAAILRDQRALSGPEPKKPRAEPKLPQGPGQRLQQAKDDYQRALQTGNDLQKRDAALNLQQRQRAYDKMMNPPEPKQPRGQADFGSRLLTLIRSTRINTGGGAGGMNAAPLVGRFMDLFGAGGPLGMAVAAGAMLIDKLGESANRAAARVSEYGNAQFLAGGTPQETAEMSSLGRTVGIDPAAMAGMAREFAARQASDPFSRQEAQRAGIVDPFGGSAAFGKLDTAQELSKAIDYIAKSANDQEAQRRARILGLEQLGNVRLMSQHTRNLLKADAELAARVNDRGYQKESVELQAQTGRLQTAFENLENAGIRPLIGPLSKMAGWLTDLLNSTSNLLDNTGKDPGDRLPKGMASPTVREELNFLPDKWVRENPLLAIQAAVDPTGVSQARSIKSLEKFNQNNPDIAVQYAQIAKDRQDAATGNGEGAGANDPNTSALDKNTDAINRLIVVHGKEAHMYGGGPRSRGAVPSRWRGPDVAHDMNDELTRQSYRLGAF